MDRRTKYSLNIINETALELLNQKDVSKITVTELCEKADINRATFYKYYRDIYDLVENIESNLYNEIKKAIEKVNETETIKPFVTSIINTISENKNACRVLLGKYGNKEFVSKIIYLAYVESATEWKHGLKNFSSEEIDYIFYFFAYGCIGIIEKWISNNFIESANEIINLITNLSDILLKK